MMRRLTKLETPAILAERAEQWTAAFLAAPNSEAHRFRYRHADIKARLIEETGGKCVYCESKIGHNTPGDVEHKRPSSAEPSLHFSWVNLTLACSECNRRKGDYDDGALPFLDPYADDVEDMVVHEGPIVLWQLGNARAETSVRLLELHNQRRAQLIFRKIEKIDEISSLCSRVLENAGSALAEMLKLELEQRKSPAAEYSGMVCAVLEKWGA
jgi:uncharacterized protein (TIGR02646 family)